MTHINVSNLSLYFPVIGADSQSLKRYLKQVAIGGNLGGAGRKTVAALRNVNLSLKPGDKLGLIGANGSGKTTLLRCLAGAYAPDEGVVEVEGRIASLLDLSMGTDPTATGLENIRLRGLVAGLSPREIAAKTQAIAEFSGLGPFLAMPLKTYSAGMQARLGFATATSVEAEIILMDEWIAVGDRDFRRQAQERLTSLVEQAHILVVSSHDPGLIQSICNKVMRLDHGMASEVVDVADMEDLIAAPAPSAERGGWGNWRRIRQAQNSTDAGEWASALAQWETVLGEYPDFVWARYGRACALEWLDRGDEAVRELEALARKGDEAPVVLERLAEIFLRRHEPDSALAYFRQLLAVPHAEKPRIHRVAVWIAREYLRQGGPFTSPFDLDPAIASRIVAPMHYAEINVNTMMHQPRIA